MNRWGVSTRAFFCALAMSLAAGMVRAEEAVSVSAAAPETEFKVPRAKLPLQFPGDCDEESAPAYLPSGRMGNSYAIDLDECWPLYPHSGGSCIKITYREKGGWGGVVWQNPPNDWGKEPGGWDLTGASRLSVMARGELGGEVVEFKLGILRNKDYSDSCTVSSGRVRLTAGWERYTVSLAGKDLHCIKTGFVVTVVGRDEPVTFYLDDLQYE